MVKKFSIFYKKLPKIVIFESFFDILKPSLWIFKNLPASYRHQVQAGQFYSGPVPGRWYYVYIIKCLLVPVGASFAERSQELLYQRYKTVVKYVCLRTVKSHLFSLIFTIQNDSFNEVFFRKSF